MCVGTAMSLEHMLSFQWYAPFFTFAQDVGHVGWNAPRFGCELVMKTLGEKKQARILDAASGTGLGGKLVSDVHVPVLRYLYVSRWWQQLKDRYRVALVA